MKFLSFINKKTNTESWGVLSAKEKVLDLSFLAPKLLNFLQSDWGSKLSLIQEKLSEASLSLNEIELLACLPQPTSMRDAYTFRQHVEQMRKNRGVPMIPEYDLFPVFYFMNHQSVIGPGPCPVQKLHLEQLDFELESAIVIGKKGKNISASEADDYIFGYTILNDFSARSIQMEEMKLSMGPCKGKDFANALGPYLVTRDELAPYRQSSPQGERYSLEMTTEVNGKAISKGNMQDMTWTFAQVLERASYGAWIYPGDVFGSGCVGTGCFHELNPKGITHQWLRPGDKVLLKITGLGELENVIELIPDQKQ